MKTVKEHMVAERERAKAEAFAAGVESMRATIATLEKKIATLEARLASALVRGTAHRIAGHGTSGRYLPTCSLTRVLWVWHAVG